MKQINKKKEAQTTGRFLSFPNKLFHKPPKIEKTITYVYIHDWYYRPTKNRKRRVTKNIVQFCLKYLKIADGR